MTDKIKIELPDIMTRYNTSEATAIRVRDKAQGYRDTWDLFGNYTDWELLDIAWRHTKTVNKKNGR